MDSKPQNRGNAADIAHSMVMSGSNTSLLFAGSLACPHGVKKSPALWRGCRTQRAYVDLITLTAASLTVASCSSPFGQLTALLSEVFFYDRIHMFIALDDLKTCRSVLVPRSMVGQVCACLRVMSHRTLVHSADG